MAEPYADLDWRREVRRLDGAYAPATLRSYRADAEAFEAWCHTEGEVAFPARIDVLSRFLEEQGQRKSPSTVRRRLAGIRKIHRLLRLPDPTCDEAISIAMRRILRANPVRAKQAKGMTREYLDRFIATQPITPLGLRNRAMLSVGYELLARRSELVALRNEDLEERADGSFRILIRRGKADPFGQGRLAFTSASTAHVLRAWLALRGPDIPWVFCPVYSGRPVNRDLSTTTVRRLIKDAAAHAGLAPDMVKDFSGHSMRVGAAQDLLRRGQDTAAIMRAGGWKSVNVLASYLEKAEHSVWA